MNKAHCLVLTLACSLLITPNARVFGIETDDNKGSVVVTQIESRSYWSLWLFSSFFSQDLAHFMILENHDVTAIPTFTASALVDVDVVYLSPSLDELKLTPDEINVLDAYVTQGGRLIVAADNGLWADEFRLLAAHFDVTYGTTYINGVTQATLDEPTHPLFNGRNGIVRSFSGASHNNSLTSTNPDFRALATWKSGPTSIGYLPHGAGEIFFLTDFNTWDNDMINDFDNEAIWRNLFEVNSCYPDCDQSTGKGTLDIFDFLCFQGHFITGDDPACDCDTSTGTGVCDVFDFLCFQNAFVAGCP